MVYSSLRSSILPRVRRVNKLPIEDKEKRLQFWVNRSRHLFEQGSYDLGYEYIAKIELNLYLSLDKGDSFKLILWRMFVMDFRRAFSDYEFEKFQCMKEDFN